MTKRLTHWTQDKKNEACLMYAIKGSLAVIERELDIPQSTVHGWKEQDWWIELIEEVRSQKADLHVARYHELTELALDQAIAKIGDADARSAATVAAIATDKARLLLNQPTSIRANDNSTNQVLAFLETISDQYRESQANVIKTQEKSKG